MTEEHKRKISLAMMGNENSKGREPWNKGKRLPKVARDKIVARNKSLVGAKHPLWKGSEASYGAIHDWVERHFLKPRLCVFCKSTKKDMYHWANKSGEYKRERGDWIRLCASCHTKYDGNYKRRKRDKRGRFL